MKIRGVLALLLVVPACSSTSPTQACADVSTAVCNKIQQCASAAISLYYGDVATCATRTESTCNASLAVTNTGDTAGNVEDCAKAYATITCADALDNAPPKQCAHNPGTLADGAVCGTAGQCKSGVCQFDSTGCGKCIEPVASGGTCNETPDCLSGLVCALTATTSTSATATCVAPAASGGTCSTKVPIVPCQAGLVCNAGKCQAPLPSGSACDPKVQPTLCDQANGYFCTPIGTRCQLAVAAGTGQPCGYDIKTGNYSYCTGSGFCGNVDTQTGLGTCIAPAGDGAPCDVTKGPLCLPPAVCKLGDADGSTSGTCTPPDPSMCH
jgi:hypothetical protein